MRSLRVISDRKTHVQSKEVEKILFKNGTEKKARVAILIPDKIDFKTRDKEGSSSTSWYLLRETKNTTLKRHVHPCLYSSIIYNSQGSASVSVMDEWIERWRIHTMGMTQP